MAGVGQVSRRERLRNEALTEITSIALTHITERGAANLSLRAIAREMGMTPGAIYSYFDTRAALLAALIADVYNSLAETLEAAVAAAGEDPARRILAYGRGYRRWSVANPEKFRLVYGDPIPDFPAFADAAAAEAEHRACTVLTGVVWAAWESAEPLYASKSYRWADFEPAFRSMVRAAFPDLPPAAAAVALRLWGRLHGPVSLEVYGHLKSQIKSSESLFEDELHSLLVMLGLT